MTTYNSLILKLDTFIRKYYKNKLLKGALLTISMLITAYVLTSLTEYYARFSVNVRTVLFFAFILGLSSVLLIYIILPALKLLKIGKILSYREASEIISEHFSEIKDKLLNILELHEQNNTQNSLLIEAGINQKIDKIKVFSFPKAVNYKENYKYLKFLLPVLLLFAGIFLFNPRIFSESNERLVNYNTFYQAPLPFNFNLLNDTLSLKKGDDFTVKLEITGIYVPNEVFISYFGNSFLMKKKNKADFEYTFKNVNNDLKFNFDADRFSSQNYDIKVLPSPLVIDFSLFADVPKYTGEQNKTYSNTGDIVVPYGTKLKWKFNTKDIDSLKFTDNKNKEISANRTENIFSVEKTVFNDFGYKISVLNSFFTLDNLVDYHITVVPDLYPSISVNTLKDSANFFVSYFNGRVGDDYGIKSLNLKYRSVDSKTKPEDKKITFKTIPISLESNRLKQQFYYVIDFSKLEKDDDKTVQYYFEVWDNDGVTGSKSARTHTESFSIPSYEEKNRLENQATENISSKIEQSISLAKEIQSDISELKQKNMSGESSEWETTQMLKSIVEKQKKFEQLIQQAAEENKAKNEMQNDLSEQQKELLEKQKQLQKLMESVMTDELKELMKQIEELQKQFDKKLMDKLTEKMEMSMEDMNKELDRNLELLKRYEAEQKIDEAINELNKLAEKQEKLSKETQSKETDNELLKEKQAEIKERFDMIKKEYNEAKEINEKLKKPMKLEDFEEMSKEVQEEFKESKEQLEKKKSKKASESQKKNSKNMKKMADKMEAMMEGNSEEQNSEDEDALRQILDNLLSFSFTQEEIMKELKQTNLRNPKYIEITKRELDIRDDFTMIEDSLRALASRVFQINSVVSKELSAINTNIQNTLNDLEDSKKNNAQRRQQEVMTSANKLALLLNEILESMKNTQPGGGGGSGKKKCNKPKSSGEPSFKDLKKQQEAMKKAMEKMLKGMKEGKGKNGKSGKNGMNKQLAQQLAQQEIFKQMMQEMMGKKSLNSKSQKLMNEINKMIEETEKDLVNKKITPELLKRQQEITTRLLEAEKAENQREEEKKRQSKTGQEKQYKSPKEYFNKQSENSGFDEDLFYNNLKMNNFYKNLYEKYSEKIGE